VPNRILGIELRICCLRKGTDEMKRAREVDPFSPLIHALSGRLMYQPRQYGQAVEHLRNALAIRPGLWVVHTFFGGVKRRPNSSGPSSFRTGALKPTLFAARFARRLR
jgi:hypothetical protein